MCRSESLGRSRLLNPNLRDLPALMVAADDDHPIWPPYFERHYHADSFNAVVAPASSSANQGFMLAFHSGGLTACVSPSMLALRASFWVTQPGYDPMLPTARTLVYTTSSYA
jgi:hypothetical protein